METKEILQTLPNLSISEWEGILTDLINSPAFSLAPALSDAAIIRESIYTREDEMLKLYIHKGEDYEQSICS